MNEAQKYRAIYREIYKNSRKFSAEEADAEIDFVMELLTGKKAHKIWFFDIVSTDSLHKAQDIFLQRVETMKPLQHILGQAFFCGNRYFVNENTLIPRPETEFLVKECIKRAPRNTRKILDIGTGSGCIAVELAKVFKDSLTVAADISEKALETALSNAELHNAADKIKFIRSDLFENIDEEFDIIVSNPPYIAFSDKNEVQKEVYDYEPHSALFAEENGFYFYRKIIEVAHNFLTENGLIAFEVGWKQAQKVSEMLSEKGFSEINIIKDLDGINRVVSAIKIN
ncbi:MAG: peptide chain release factor N(5)-glutamine methyltransferase [Candidatus Gastranaerophilales bacterium]|nr:peptide chain release factor N(5)-glutamine methyltransferase [Candidatus Gastranaerophilales bacterium]